MIISMTLTEWQEYEDRLRECENKIKMLQLDKDYYKKEFEKESNMCRAYQEQSTRLMCFLGDHGYNEGLVKEIAHRYKGVAHGKDVKR